MNTDMGSIELVGRDRQTYTDGRPRYIYSYQGFSGDFDKLPVLDDMAAGSSCLFLDDGSYARFHAKTKTWYMI